MYKQLIIARKDLNMSPGKLAAQVSHASMAFLTAEIRNHIQVINDLVYRLSDKNLITGNLYTCNLTFDAGLYEDWIEDSFTKVICEARNKNQLMKAVTIANELDLREGVDYFLIRDNCLTELEPEDEDGRTLTCIGFKPMDSTIVEKISKKYQLYR